MHDAIVCLRIICMLRLNRAGTKAIATLQHMSALLEDGRTLLVLHAGTCAGT